MNDKEYLKASNGNGEPLLATVSEDRAVGSLILKVDGTTNFPRKFIATTGDIDNNGYLVATTMTQFFGHTTQEEPNRVFIDKIVPGYHDIGNVSGQKVSIKPTSEWANIVGDTVGNVGNMFNINSGEYVKLSISETQPEPDSQNDILWLKPIGD